MNIFLGGMFLLSLVVAWIMAGNLSQDESKERFKLTKDYKKYKDENYVYNEKRGSDLYLQICANCHKADGSGKAIAPPLLNSQIVLNEEEKLLKIVIKGFKGAIVRNGKNYNSVMPGFKAIPHEDLTHVINFVRKNFGNENSELIPTVRIITTKIDTLTKKGAYSESEL